MYIVEVSPIEKGLPMESLTYYSKTLIQVGDLVSINVNNRKGIRALAIHVDDARNQKANIKSNDWNTKKVEGIIVKGFIEEDLLLHIYNTAIEYILPVPTLLALLFDKKYWAKPTPARDYLENKLAQMRPYSLHNYNPHVERDMYRVLKSALTPLEQCYRHCSGLTRFGEGDHPNAFAFIPSPNLGEGARRADEGGNLHIIRDEFEYKTPLISAVTDKLIRNTLNNIYDGGKGKLLIYTYRKGEAPLSRCYDCGQDVLCPDCNMPLVLHRQVLTQQAEGASNKYYLCHHCGHREDLHFNKSKGSTKSEVSNTSNDNLTTQIDSLERENNMYRCGHCDSWRVMPLGISTGSVVHNILDTYAELSLYSSPSPSEKGLGLAGRSHDVVRDEVGGVPLLYQIDGDVTMTKAATKNILKAWNDNGGILVANDKIFNAGLKVTPDYSIIISIDGLFSMPIADIDERAYALIMSICEFTKKDVMLHTHLYNLPLFKALSLIDMDKRDQELHYIFEKNLTKLKLAKLYPYYHNISTLYDETLSSILDKSGIIYTVYKRYNKEYININIASDIMTKDASYMYKIYNILLSKRKYNEIKLD